MVQEITSSDEQTAVFQSVQPKLETERSKHLTSDVYCDVYTSFNVKKEHDWLILWRQIKWICVKVVHKIHHDNKCPTFIFHSQILKLCGSSLSAGLVVIASLHHWDGCEKLT